MAVESDTDLSDIEFVNVDPIISGSDEQWLWQPSVNGSASYLHQDGSDHWCRSVFEEPSTDIESIRRSLLFKLEAFMRVPATPRASTVRAVSATPVSVQPYGDVVAGRNKTSEPFSPPTIKPSLLSLGSNTATVSRMKPAGSHTEITGNGAVSRGRAGGSTNDVNHYDGSGVDQTDGYDDGGMDDDRHEAARHADAGRRSLVNTNTFTRPKQRKELSLAATHTSAVTNTPQVGRPHVDSSTITRPRRIGSLSMPDVVSASGEGDDGEVGGGDGMEMRGNQGKMRSPVRQLAPGGDGRDGAMRKLSQDSLLDYELQKVDDVTDIEVMARMQEEDLRKSFSTPRKSPQVRSPQHRPSLNNIVNGTSLKMASRSASGPLLGAGSQYAAVSSQSLGSAGGSMEFSGSPDSPYGGSNQYMNAEKAAAPPHRGSSVPNLNHNLSLAPTSSQPDLPRPTSRLHTPQSGARQPAAAPGSGMRQPAQSTGNLRQPAQSVGNLRQPAASSGLRLASGQPRAAAPTGLQRPSQPTSGLKQPPPAPAAATGLRAPARAGSTGNMAPPSSTPANRAGRVAQPGLQQPRATGTVAQPAPARGQASPTRSSGIAAPLPARSSGIPAPRPTGLPRPASKLHQSADSAMATSDRSAAATGRKLTVPRSYQDNWKDGCF